MDSAPVRPRPRAGHPAQHPRADRPRPACDRRRRVGQAAVGWPQHRAATTCPPTLSAASYPIELVRAITLTWLFAGLRSDEIVRLRVGLHSLAARGTPIPGDTDEVLARDAVCLLDVPAHKTGTAFTKPVDPLLGQAIEAWEAVRPTQPADARPQDRRACRICCSPSAPAASARPTSTRASSRRSAARPASRPPTSAATSPATGPAPPSPASSTTPRNR